MFVFSKKMFLFSFDDTIWRFNSVFRQPPKDRAVKPQSTLITVSTMAAFFFFHPRTHSISRPHTEIAHICSSATMAKNGQPYLEPLPPPPIISLSGVHIHTPTFNNRTVSPFFKHLPTRPSLKAGGHVFILDGAKDDRKEIQSWVIYHNIKHGSFRKIKPWEMNCQPHGVKFKPLLLRP